MNGKFRMEWEIVIAMLSAVSGALIAIGFASLLDYMKIASWARIVELPIGLMMFIGAWRIVEQHKRK